MKNLHVMMTFCVTLLIVNLMIGNIEVNVFATADKTLTTNMDEVKRKFEPWLFEKIQNLTLADPTKKITLAVCLADADGNSKEIDETIYADLFSEKYDAETVYVADRLGIIIVKTSAENALDIATHNNVLQIGDGNKKLKRVST